MHWLLTRPEGQNHALATRIRALGHRVSVAPALKVLPWQDETQAHIWQRLGDFDALLFTSVNAVSCFAEALAQRKLPWPRARYLAIGHASATALGDHQQTALCPPAGFTSEDLLALPQLDELAGKSLLLVTGVGGRGLLAPALSERGLVVARLDVYRRSCDPSFVWPREKVDGLLVTSLESWHCLRNHCLHKHCLQNRAADDLRDCVVIAGSARIAAQVTALVRTTLTAASPSDDDMLAVLQEMHP